HRQRRRGPSGVGQANPRRTTRPVLRNTVPATSMTSARTVEALMSPPVRGMGPVDPAAAPVAVVRPDEAQTPTPVEGRVTTGVTTPGTDHRTAAGDRREGKAIRGPPPLLPSGYGPKCGTAGAMAEPPGSPTPDPWPVPPLGARLVPRCPRRWNRADHRRCRRPGGRR